MNIHYTSQFKRDYKKIKKQGKAVDELKTVIEILVSGNQLDPEYRDHPLIGGWRRM